LDYDFVQAFGNYFERGIITVLDRNVPLVPFLNNKAVDSINPKAINKHNKY
jgi:hypothetical protein